MLHCFAAPLKEQGDKTASGFMLCFRFSLVQRLSIAHKMLLNYCTSWSWIDLYVMRPDLLDAHYFCCFYWNIVYTIRGRVWRIKGNQYKEILQLIIIFILINALLKGALCNFFTGCKQTETELLIQEIAVCKC